MLSVSSTEASVGQTVMRADAKTGGHRVQSPGKGKAAGVGLEAFISILNCNMEIV